MFKQFLNCSSIICLLLILSNHNSILYNILKSLLIRNQAEKMGINQQLEEFITVTNIDDNITKWEQMAKATNLYICILEKYTHPLNQIKHYNWFYTKESLDKVNIALSRLNFLTPQDKFEKDISYKTKISILEDHDIDVNINGSIDCINTTYGPIEFKFVSEIKKDHILQVIVYSCLYYYDSKTYLPYYLYNIKTGQTIKITIKEPHVNIPIILDSIIKNKVLMKDLKLELNDLIEKIISLK